MSYRCSGCSDPPPERPFPSEPWTSPAPNLRQYHNIRARVDQQYHRFIKNFAILSESLVTLTRKGFTFAWTKLHEDREVINTYASRSLHLSQRRYCTTRREMLAAVAMCTHFRSYLRGAQFTLRTDHSSLRWLQKFRNSDDMLARWYPASFRLCLSTNRELNILTQMAFQPDCPVSSSEENAGDAGSSLALMDQSFASSAMGDSMDADLLPELSGETWVAATYLDEVTADFPPAESEPDLIVASRLDITLIMVRKWVQSGSAPSWSDCAGLSLELWCWQLQFGNLSIDTYCRLWRRQAHPATTSQLVVPLSERRDFIRRYHDSIFAGHLGVSRTVYRLLDWVYWPGPREEMRSYLASCSICLARKSPCPWQARWVTSQWATIGTV